MGDATCGIAALLDRGHLLECADVPCPFLAFSSSGTLFCGRFVYVNTTITSVGEDAECEKSHKYVVLVLCEIARRNVSKKSGDDAQLLFFSSQGQECVLRDSVQANYDSNLKLGPKLARELCRFRSCCEKQRVCRGA